MRLDGTNGNSFELTISRYEFPDGSGFDADWLVVDAFVVTPERQWRFSDPSLTTGEGREIFFWLRSATNPDWPGFDLGFTEPNLSFRRIAVAEGRVRLQVGFDLEARPPHLDDELSGEPFWVDFEMDERACLAAADDWENELLAFSPRST